MPHPATAFRAERLATLDGLVTLPAAVSNAVHAYQAAQQMPVPAWPQPGAAAAQATADTAAQIARAALDDPGVLTQPFDVTPISAARDAEQTARDRVTLAAETQAAAQELLCATVAAHLDAVVQAIQARHAEMAAVLAKCAHRLPPGTDDQAALQEGGSIRSDFLAARDATATAASLREALR